MSSASATPQPPASLTSPQEPILEAPTPTRPAFPQCSVGPRDGHVQLSPPQRQKKGVRQANWKQTGRMAPYVEADGTAHGSYHDSEDWYGDGDAYATPETNDETRPYADHAHLPFADPNLMQQQQCAMHPSAHQQLNQQQQPTTCHQPCFPQTAQFSNQGACGQPMPFG